MKKRTIGIHAGPRGRAILADAIRCFADAAYPPGGSDCAQVSRETLFTSAAIVASNDPVPQVSSRHRVMLRQAAQWYCDNIESIPDAARAELTDALTRLLKGEAVDDSVFSAIEQAPH